MNRIITAVRLLGVAFLILLSGCAPELVEEPFEPATSHADYHRALELLDLHETSIGREWIAASESALAQPVSVETPFEEIVLLDPHTPDALGYEFAVARGRAITITMETEMERYFADLYRVERSESDAEHAVVLVGSRPEDETQIRFEPRRDGRYLLRIQPELLRGGRMRVRIVATASLAFPVDGAGPGSIRSFYGDARDGGLRVHEGIDIFGPRGTLLLAASDSLVARVGERDRGGNIVTLHDEHRDLLLYYAHLDEQLVRQGDRVSEGQPIGTMGNTGNAITTPPHLHIGVYQGSWRSAVDPWDYFVDPPLTEPAPPVFDELTGGWLRLEGATALLSLVAAEDTPARWVNRNPQLRQEGAGESRASGPPRTDETPADHVERDGVVGILAVGAAVQVVGATGTVLRVRTPEGKVGYVHPETLTDDAMRIHLPDGEVVRDLRSGDPFLEIRSGMEVDYLGRDGERMIVGLPGGRVGFTGE